MTRFIHELWQTVEDIYQAIVRHPFIEGLTSGTLDNNIFKQYIIQDALYLSRFARAVALVAVKASDDESSLTLLRNAEATLSFERKSLHEFLFAEWGFPAENLQAIKMSPVNQAYTDFLVATAYERPFEQGLAAILPCFWVYLEVGKTLLKHGSPNPTYQRWINTYSSPEYEQAVENVKQLMETSSQSLSGHEKNTAAQLFRLSTIYEYMFWDEAFKQTAWPFKP